MKSAFLVLKEQFKHFYLIRRLSLYELISKNKNNYLGIIWEILNPSIQVAIYAYVFGVLRARAPVEVSGHNIDFFDWLLAAFFVWTFFFQATIQGSKSIYSKLKMLSKMNFPISVIPTYTIFTQFYVHVIMMAIVILYLQFEGYSFTIYYLQLIYFIFATCCLLFVISLITSTLSTIIRDIHLLLNSVLRMLIYVSGILWPLSILKDFSPAIIVWLKLNPLYYLVEGYRAAFFTTEWYFITNWQYTLYFWGLIIVLLLFGSMIHVKFRRHLIDYL